MTRRYWFSLFGSTAIGLSLIALLLAAAKLNLSAAIEPLAVLRPQMLALLVALLGINTFIAGEKWRLVERRMSRGGGAAIPRPLYFALTAIGVALGLVMPIQLSAALSRSLGSHFYGGRGIVRGGAATIFEQFFDLLAAVFLSLASGTLILFGGGGIEWVLLASTIGIIGIIATTFGIRLVVQSLRWLGSLKLFARSVRGMALLDGILSSSLLATSLGRQLFLLSMIRFLVFMLMAGAITAAARLDIPLWQVSAALPLVALATAIPITPAGLGVTEWVYTSVLVMFGTPFELAAQWVVLNRILATLACLVIGVAGVLVGAGTRLLSRKLVNAADRPVS